MPAQNSGASIGDAKHSSGQTLFLRNLPDTKPHWVSECVELNATHIFFAFFNLGPFGPFGPLQDREG